MSPVHHYLLAIALVFGAIGSARAAAPSLRVDDFEDLDLEAATGLSWVALGDWLVGGASTGTLTAVRPAPGNRSRGALRLDVHLRDGAKTRFAGAWTALRADGVTCDLTGYAALRFRVRGTPGRYQAGVRRVDDKSAANFMAPVDVTAAWTVVELRLGDLQQSPATPAMAFATTGIGWLGITTSDTSPRDFALEIDDVAFAPEPPRDAATARSTHKLRLTEPRSLDQLSFATIGRDDRGDGISPRLPDARELQVATDAGDDRVWFRFVLHGPPSQTDLGLNVALDVDGDPDNGGAWWGQNKKFRFDRLITAYLSRGAGYWQGFLGVADAAQIASFAVDGRSSDVRVVVDAARRTLSVGVPRAALGLAPGRRVRLIGTVGSSFTFNDDTPADGALEVELPDPAVKHSMSH